MKRTPVVKYAVGMIVGNTDDEKEYLSMSDSDEGSVLDEKDHNEINCVVLGWSYNGPEPSNDVSYMILQKHSSELGLAVKPQGKFVILIL